MRDGLAWPAGCIPVWGAELPRSSRAPQPWRTAQASACDPLGAQAARSPAAHSLCTDCVQAPRQPLGREGADMAPALERCRGLLDTMRLASIRVHLASWLGPRCPLPYGLHVLPSHTHSSATCGPSDCQPLLGQSPLPGMPFPSEEIQPSFRLNANSTSPRSPLNKHESLSPCSGILGCL